MNKIFYFLLLFLGIPFLVFSQTTTLQNSAQYGGVVYSSASNSYATQAKTSIYVGRNSSSSYTCGRGYLEFDLTNVSLTNLTSARLILYGSSP